jgi:biotin carboxylase
MTLANKTLAILGGTRIDCEIVEAAKNLGVKTVVISYDAVEDSPAKQLADESVELSVSEVEAVAEYIRDNHIDGVMVGYSDTLLPWYVEICELAGLPCYGSRETIDIFTNKPLWKAECRRFGVPTAHDYDDRVLNSNENDISFPLFLKPARGSGARGTSIVRNKEELVAAWRKAEQVDPDRKVLVEQYLSGPELTVFWLFVDGEYYVYLLGNRHVKHNQEKTIPLPAGYTFPAKSLPDYLRDIAPNVRKMLRSLGVENGMMFMQCIMQDGIAYVYDIGYRLTGSLEYRLTKALSDYSPMDMLINFAITGRMTDDPDIERKVAEALHAPCFNISVLMEPGTIERFTGLKLVEKNPYVVASVKAHVEGETLPPEAKGELRQIALRILGIAPDAKTMEQVVLSLQNVVDIVSTEGDSLKLAGLTSEDFDEVLSGGYEQ